MKSVESYLGSLGYGNVVQIKGGHTQAVLYRMQNHTLGYRVAKVSSRDDANREIADNRLGYESIAAEGAQSLLPDFIEYRAFDQREVIILTDLGSDITHRDRQNDLSAADYTSFTNTLKNVVLGSIRSGNEILLHEKGLLAVHEQIKYWGDKIAVSDSQYYKDFADVDISALCSNKTSVAVMDFTPDNVFFYNSKISYIDPWRQTTYRGSFIPSLSQFMTLAVEVYRLPGAIRARHDFEKCISELGALLDLTPDQIKGQYQLGEILQYLLSASVRMETDATQAQVYIERAFNGVGELRDTIIRIKGEM